MRKAKFPRDKPCAGAVSQLGVRGIVTTAILALLGWVIWAFLTYIIGTKLLPVPETKTDLPR
mgnify:CR=1 FL=1